MLAVYPCCELRRTQGTFPVPSFGNHNEAILLRCRKVNSEKTSRGNIACFCLFVFQPVAPLFDSHSLKEELRVRAGCTPWEESREADIARQPCNASGVPSKSMPLKGGESKTGLEQRGLTFSRGQRQH